MDEVPDALAIAVPSVNDAGECERRRRIIDAAYELLDEAGLEGLTIRAVLNRTGLARRAFYERFESKDALVLAVFEQSLQTAAVEFRQRAQEAADPLEAIRQVVVGIVGTLEAETDTSRWSVRRSAALSREHLRLAESRPAELQAALRPLLGFIAEQVREGIRLGRLRECDPDLQARLIYNLVATTVHTELLSEDAGQRDARYRMDLAQNVWEFCRRAIIG